LEFLNRYPLSFLWGGVIFILCAIKISNIPSDGIAFPGIDKFVHFTFFLLLSLIVVYEDHKQQYPNKSRLKASIGLIILGLVYGGGIELLQKFIFTYRSAEWLDLAADMGGCILAILIFNVILYLRKIIY
jgi:VanZ family protein